ncbi:MAG: penicillin-binding protein 1C [Flavobacteriales bacterium]
MAPLFDVPHGTVLLDRDGALLGATVASDGQWRLPGDPHVPARFERCLLEFEDRHFRAHWGVHVPSLIRAMIQNLRAGRTVSGGSTLTMQVARLSRAPGSRSYLHKLMETLLALRLELRYSKDEILELYAANAPFGANVVGLEAAAWRWFGRKPEDLSWAENATLAVLPNAPSRIHPGHGRLALKAKRDRLLGRLLAIGALDSLSWSLALDEPLPDIPVPLPRKAPHLLATLRSQGFEGQRIQSTVELERQERITAMADRYARTLNANEVHNAAVLVLDVPSGEVVAYVGNLTNAGAQHAGAVDIIHARRSTGSLLKPFLFADMLQSGERMPDQLVADLPTQYEGFSPRNYDQRYDGAVHASEALSRSLNVPAVRALRSHGIDRTIRLLRAMGLHHVDRSAEDYGLSLIVGGAESTLWELTGAYASMARVLVHSNGERNAGLMEVHPPVAHRSTPKETRPDGPPPLSAASIFHTLIALQDVKRPEAEAGWRSFTGTDPIAWKTGTSFGHRDAWAIGVNDRYAVGVWTGNASGEGRPGLTGTLAAAPLLFEVFDALPRGNGYDPPFDDMTRMAVCRSSGHRAGPDCSPVDTLWTLTEASRTVLCPYHERILVNEAGTHRLRPGKDARSTTWFVLPPAMEHYYTASHPGYRSLPPWSVEEVVGTGMMEMIYPENGARILLPIRLDGSQGQVVLELAHRERTTVHWDLDGVYLGSTTDDHRFPIEPTSGPHRLTVTDAQGRRSSISFLVQKAGP